MSSRVADLLIDLSKDPFKCEEFRTDPERFVGNGHFDETERAVLIAANEEAIVLHLAAKKGTKKKGTKKNNKVLRTITDFPEVS